MNTRRYTELWNVTNIRQGFSNLLGITQILEILFPKGFKEINFGNSWVSMNTDQKKDESIPTKPRVLTDFTRTRFKLKALLTTHFYQ